MNEWSLHQKEKTDWKCVRNLVQTIIIHKFIHNKQ